MSEDELKLAVRDAKNFWKSIQNVAGEVRYYEERVSKLRQVSGYDTEKLIELFAAGYTLVPPEYKHLNETLADFM